MIEVILPKDYSEAIKLIDDSGKEVRWSFYSKTPNQILERMYNAYTPIAYIYENNELKYAAHKKLSPLNVYDTADNLVKLSDEDNDLIIQKLNTV